MLLNEKFRGTRIILGSGSPRRRELLAGLGLDFTVEPQTSFMENNEANLPTAEIAEYMAKGKSFGHRALADDELLITSDTIVLIPDMDLVLGKPSDRSDAIAMLESLSGRKHVVETGVCIRTNRKCVSFTAFSDVYFKSLTREEIEYYVDHFRPYDKAGSYGVQEWMGYAGITKIEGSFYNVMGLPVQRLYDELMKF
ncbi:MAG: Maf family nucleotide pyrophosphatase [Candidatus Egerieousia sp.]|nr:Maf family nucleotide pyrophosphatase [Candidatus Egerieousia sp.]